MNDEPPGTSAPPPQPPAPPPPYDDRRRTAPEMKLPESGQEALLNLVMARLGLIKIEAAEAGAHAGKRLAAAVLAGVLGLFLWALILAGGIGLLAHYAGWHWFWITLAVAGLHAGVIFLLLTVVRKTPPTAFPITRAEFEKDREWIETLKKRNWKD
jgi:uncharacterized membrane protein YqjE